MDENDDVHNIVERFEELESSRNELVCANQSLITKISDLEKALAEFENTHKVDRKVIIKQELTIQNLQKEIEDLRNNSHSKKNEDMAQLEKENCILKKQNEMRLTQFKDTVHELGEQIKEKENHVNLLEDQLNEIKMKLKDYQHLFETISKENQSLKEDKKTCENVLEELRAELLECEQNKYKLEVAFRKNQSYIKQLKNELANESAHNAELNVKLGHLIEEQNENNEYIKELDRQLNDMETDIDYYRQELDRKNDEFQRYKNTVSNIKDKTVTVRVNALNCRKIDSFYCPNADSNNTPMSPILKPLSPKRQEHSDADQQHMSSKRNSQHAVKKHKSKNTMYQQDDCHDSRTSLDKYIKCCEEYEKKLDEKMLKLYEPKPKKKSKENTKSEPYHHNYSIFSWLKGRDSKKEINVMKRGLKKRHEQDDVLSNKPSKKKKEKSRTSIKTDGNGKKHKLTEKCGKVEDAGLSAPIKNSMKRKKDRTVRSCKKRKGKW